MHAIVKTAQSLHLSCQTIPQKASTTLMPCRVVYEKAIALYFTVHTVPHSSTAAQQTTYVRVAATVVQL